MRSSAWPWWSGTRRSSAAANDDRDELFVEFWHKGEHVGEVYPDVERRRFVLTLYPRDDSAWWIFPLDEFQDAVRRGVARLEERGYPDSPRTVGTG